MNGFSSILKMQFRHMAARREFKAAFTVTLAFVVFAFFEECAQIKGADRAGLYSAASGWIGNAGFRSVWTMQLFYMLFILLAGSLAFSDSQFMDGKRNIRNAIVTRCPRKAYILAGAAVSFCGAFLVIALPLLASQLLSFLVFPLQSSVAGDPGTPAPSYLAAQSWTGALTFTWLYYQHPYLYNLLTVFYDAFCAGAFALLSFVLSFFVKRGRILIIGIPTFLVCAEDIIPWGSYDISCYFFDVALVGKSDLFFIAIPLAVLAVDAVFLFLKIHILRDELA